MLTVQDVRSVRNQVIREIDAVFLEMIQKIENPCAAMDIGGDEGYDSIYPLTFNAGEFKGTKPTALLFGEERIPVYTWRMVFQKIMERCNADADKHKALLDLRSRISGRTRAILSDSPDGMRSSLKIDKKLYAEMHYDTGTLLHILLHRILDPVKYDYSDIYVAVRK